VRYACLALTGVLWWLGAQQPGWFALGWIALAPFLWAASSLPPRARWKYGYLTGIAGYALINWWIVVAVTRGAPMIGAPPAVGTFLGAVGVLLIGLIQGTQVGLIALAWQPHHRLIQRTPWLLPLGIALLWYVLETLRSSTPLAHSWGALAFTQWRDTALLQSVSLMGQHGLSALCVWFAASLALWLRHPQAPAHLWRGPVLAFVALHAWGAWRLWSYDRSTPGRQELRVLLVQTSVSSLRKNQEGGRTISPFAQAYQLTRNQLVDGGARKGKYDLVLWPETTVSLLTAAMQPSPLAVSQNKNSILIRGGAARTISELCREFGVSLLTGANNDGSSSELYNLAVLVAPDGGAMATAKQRLVPFGERAPYVDYLPFLGRLAPQPAVVPGTQSEPLPLRLPGRSTPVSVGSLICFESCFPDPARQQRRDGAQLFAVVTNDEWFGGTNAPWEHAAMAAVRAVENGVPVVQAGNGGYSFLVDPCGRFVVKSSFGMAQAIPVTVPLP